MGMPCIKSSGIKKEEAITDVIESIALMEAALSHILNAEGEKIQAVVGTLHHCPQNSDKHCPPSCLIAKDPEELLKINKSVESVINAITSLELILQKKLSLVSYRCGC